MARKKRALPDREKEPGPKKERPWWARTDQELVKERYDRFKEVLEASKVDVSEEEREQIIEEAARRDPRIRNLLDMVICKVDGIEKKNEFLLVPQYSTSGKEKIARTLSLKTHRRIRLDEYGQEVWNQIDGSRDVKEIGMYLKDRFADEVEPLYPRLAQFMAYLESLKLVTIVKKE